MAKILTWRDAWALHIDTLDDDHRALVDLFREIARRFPPDAGDPEEPPPDAGAPADAGEDLYRALERFGQVARRHFARVEELARTIDYPGLPDHRTEHALLIAELAALVRELRSRGAVRLAAPDLENLKQWVVAHVLGADRQLAEHYFRICSGDAEEP